MRLPAGARLYTYSDNLAVLARSKADAVAATNALLAAFDAAAPSLSLRVIRNGRRVADGFSHLGYWIRKRHGRVQAKPIEKRLDRFRRRYWRMWRLAMVCGRTRRKLVSYVRGWCAQFSAWDTIADFQRFMLGGVDEARRRGEMLLALARA